jgi:hypothetical protein
VTELRNYELATRRAEQFIAKEGICRLPVDPFAIARKLNIVVEAKPASASGVSGMLIRVGNDFAIGYATHIDNEGFQRFSVAHELGHYLLPGHSELIFGDGSKIHESRGGFFSQDKYEVEADCFAAGLLMPRSLFVPAMDRAGDGIEAVKFLSGVCKTALTATAIRYAQCTAVPFAFVMSCGNKIDYCFMSESLRNIKDIHWLRKGDAVPQNTATFYFNRDERKVSSSERAEGTCDLLDWFGGNRSIELIEDVLGLGSYAKTMTLLYASDDVEENDEDEEYEGDADEPHFYKSRRR